MDIPFQALHSHNEPTQLCLGFDEQEHTKLRVGKLSPHSLTKKTGFTDYMIHRQCGKRRATLLGHSFL